MSAKEPSRDNPEQISLNTNASTGKSQEREEIPALSPLGAQTSQEESAPTLSTDESPERRAFKQEPSVEDQEGIPSAQIEGPTNDDLASTQQTESASADTNETKIPSTAISSRGRF